MLDTLQEKIYDRVYTDFGGDIKLFEKLWSYLSIGIMREHQYDESLMVLIITSMRTTYLETKFTFDRGK